MHNILIEQTVNIKLCVSHLYSGLEIHLRDCLYSQLRMSASMPGMLIIIHLYCYVCSKSCNLIHNMTQFSVELLELYSDPSISVIVTCVCMSYHYCVYCYVYFCNSCGILYSILSFGYCY